MNDHKNQQYIDDFLLGQMDPETEKAFKKKMLEDPELEQEVQLQQELMQGIEAFGQQQLRAKFKKIHREVKNKKEPEKNIKRLSSRRRWLGIAASISFLVVAGYFIWQGAGKQEDLFATYFRPYPSDFGFLRGITDKDEQRKLILIQDLYNNKEFEEAIDQISPLLNEDTLLDSQLYLALGSCYLETGQSGKAIDTFTTLLEEEENLQGDHARWYLALAYLKDNQRGKALAFLNQLAMDSEADHYDKAQELLQQLR